MPEPKFQFRLEALLKHRKDAEKECQRKVAGIQQEAQKLVRLIQDAQARIEAENKAMVRDKLVGVLDMQYIAYEKRFVGNLNLHIALTQRQLAFVDQKLALARAELLAAAKARKVIEKLREKQYTRWRTELDRKEAAAMDEMGMQIAMREYGMSRRQTQTDTDS